MWCHLVATFEINEITWVTDSIALWSVVPLAMFVSTPHHYQHNQLRSMIKWEPGQMWWCHLQQQQQQEYDASRLQQARRSFFQLSLLWWIILYCAQRNFSPFPIALHPDNLLHFCFYFFDQLCFTLFYSTVSFANLYFLELGLFDTLASVVLYHTSVAVCSTAHSIAELIFLWHRLQSALQLLPAEPPGEDVARLPSLASS